MTEFPRPSLTLVIDRALYRPAREEEEDPLSLVEAAIAGGVHIVQLRPQMTANDLALHAVALRLRELTQSKAWFVMTGDLELAERCRADGILLTERSYKPSDARGYLAGDVRIAGSFAHSVQAASRAERGGADYVQVGPVFDPTGDAVQDLTLIRKVKDAVHAPVIAFGGIRSPRQAEQCIAHGADGIAVSGAILDAEDPQRAAAELREAVDHAWRGLSGD